MTNTFLPHAREIPMMAFKIAVFPHPGGPKSTFTGRAEVRNKNATDFCSAVRHGPPQGYGYVSSAVRTAAGGSLFHGTGAAVGPADAALAGNVTWPDGGTAFVGSDAVAADATLPPPGAGAVSKA
jgi:hypothetical protein